MLTLSRKSDYALIALSELAREQGEGEPISARELAARFSLPEALLMNVMKALAKAKLVDSTRGVRGGYRLARSPERVSVMDVIVAIDGPVRFAACAESLPIVGQGCELAETCPIRGPIVGLHRRIVGLLEATSLAELAAGGDRDGTGCDDCTTPAGLASLATAAP